MGCGGIQGGKNCPVEEKDYCSPDENETYLGRSIINLTGIAPALFWATYTLIV
jgi:hypothetical protein